MMQEREFIDWIRSRSGFDPAVVPVGPGDDCAVVNCGGERLIVTTDQVLDGVHLVLADCGAEAAGRKAMARSLSDVAAMAAVPLAVVATVALPEDFPTAQAEALYAGLRGLADEFNCPLVGGDVGAWAGRLAISVTAFARPGPAGAMLRSGAQPGDAVCVTGSLGGAWRGGRHLQFVPRIREAIRLAEKYPLHSMIDISDGLAVDLLHICTASLVGVELVAADVPVHPDAGSLEAALGDGEDYELLFTLPADAAAEATADAKKAIGAAVTRIGTITAATACILIGPGDARRPLETTGWQHKTKER